ncbi:MAG: deoxyribonuclease IV [Acidothermaceae bacterium]
MSTTQPKIGAHVDQEDPIAGAKARDADLAQFFLGDPQGWKAPEIRAGIDHLKNADIDLYVHSPYVINVATTNNRIRIPSRKLLAQHADAAASIGAKALIVHGGHVLKSDDPSDGIANWRKTFERWTPPLPILIENTAGGDNAMARSLDRLAMLWDAVGEFGPGFCLDTCHAHAAGIDLASVVEQVTAIAGHIDLVHANGSRDAFGSGADRHANFDDSELDPALIIEVVRQAKAPVVCETPNGATGQGADIAYLRKHLS